MTSFETIRARISSACSPSRQVLLEPILAKLELHQDCPASTSLKRHGGYVGGLCHHINFVSDLAQTIGINVFNETVKVVSKDNSSALDGLIGSSQALATIALIHDLNKVCDLDGNLHYIPNILIDGKRSEKKPWVINENYRPIQVSVDLAASGSAFSVFLQHPSIQYPSGLTSLTLAESWSPGLTADLTNDEIQAIVWHGGLYERGSKEGFANNESLLQIIFHSADMIASRIGA